MIRPFLAALIVAANCAAAPAFAQAEPQPDIHGNTLACKDELAKYAPKLATVTDGAKRDAATKQINMARESLGKHDEKMCMGHISKAMKLMR